MSNKHEAARHGATPEELARVLAELDRLLALTERADDD